MLKMFTVYVRPIVEYGSVIWNPQVMYLIKKLEGVQRGFTKRMPGLGGLSYKDRMEALGLESLELRRLHVDLCETFKIVNGLSVLKFEDFFKWGNEITRGHSKKLGLPVTRTRVGQCFFASRVVTPWNALTESTITKTSLVAFKLALKKEDLSEFLKGSFD